MCNDMDGGGEYYAKWNKSEKDKHHMILLIWVLWNKWEFKKQNRRTWEGGVDKREANHKKDSTTENKLKVAGREVGRGMG